jgi:signal transduction histidine kinase
MSPLHLNPHATEAEYRRLVDALTADASLSVVRRATLVRKDGSEVAVEKIYRSAFTGRDNDAWVITLTRDITARLADEAELRRSQDALREAEKAVAVVEDRERIARDLHDTVIQRLFAEGLSLQSLVRLVDERSAARLQATIDGLDETIKELRMAVFYLHGSATARSGLRGRLVDVMADAAPALGFEPRLQFDGPIESIDGRIAEHLVPVLREALANVSRHAAARSARISLTVDDDVTLTVSDDGIGAAADAAGGHGLTNMIARANTLGGWATLEPAPGRGSLLTWSVPSARESSGAAPATPHQNDAAAGPSPSADTRAET